jgi:hypothetical protein
MLRRKLAEEMKRSQTLVDGQHATTTALRVAQNKVKDLEGLVRALKDKSKETGHLPS